MRLIALIAIAQYCDIGFDDLMEAGVSAGDILKPPSSAEHQKLSKAVQTIEGRTGAG